MARREPKPGDDWPRLARMVRQRRESLDINQTAVGAADGPSPAIVRRIEQGRPMRYERRTIAGLMLALGWRPESFDAMLSGAEPVPVADGVSPVPPDSGEDDGRLVDLERRVRRIESALGTALEGLQRTAWSTAWSSHGSEDEDRAVGS